MPQSTVHSLSVAPFVNCERPATRVLIGSYCEENIYKLLRPLSESLPAPLTDLTVIFISNPRRAVSAPFVFFYNMSLDPAMVPNPPDSA